MTTQQANPFVDTEPPPSPPPQGVAVREAEEVFIHMHRNYRVSRNIRAHWFFDHINRTICIEDSPPDDEYGREMTVVGIVPKGGSADEIVLGERFRVSLDTRVTYISRYYRHVFLLDLSPSTIVADEETNCCLHTKLLECLRLSMASVTRRFTIPGTRRTFCPQIYVSVVVFIPFLGFEEDLVLVHGVLLTESNIESVLESVTVKFNNLLKSLYTFSKPILKKWGHLRRRHRNKYDSTCETESDTLDRENQYSFTLGDDHSSASSQLRLSHTLSDSTNRLPTKKAGLRTVDFKKQIWEVEDEAPKEDADAKCDGYIFPEWALIFMLRLGLIAVQTLPENTQSNVIVITDAVAGMPDAHALQELLNQIRSYTVSCSFIQLQGKSRSEACFGHVSSCELFHFLAMATFGAYIPNCRCSIGVDMDSITPPLPKDGDDYTVFRHLNPFHRALICWCFQNALQDNVHITNLVKEINPDFAELYRSDTIRHRAFNRTYVSSLHEVLYVRLREGFTLKSVELLDNRIKIHLSMPFRPLVFIEYAINAPWPADRKKRESIYVDLVVQSPYNEIKDLLTQVGGNMTSSNPARVKLLMALKSAIKSIESADELLMHIHSFNSHPAFYSLPDGADQFAIFHLEDGPDGHQTPSLEPVVNNPQDDFGKFLKFWSALCSMNEGIWQKWVHMHFERVILRCSASHQSAFFCQTAPTDLLDCSQAMEALRRLLKERSSFCLVRDQLYVTFVKKEGEVVPSYFYMVRVSHEQPYIVMKTAFLGGISSTERRLVVDHFRRQLIDLTIKIDGIEKPVPALSVIRRPLERILVRYQQIPSDLRTIVRISDEEKGHVKDLTMHNAVSKYLECRRRIWRLPSIHAPLVGRSTLNSSEYILSVLMHRRFEEGFKLAWSRNGIVGLCRQVYVQSGPALEQYILFPPTSANPGHFPGDRTRLPSLTSIRLDSRHQMVRERDPPILVAELWKEPCAVCDSQLLQAPTASRDDELVSVLFSIDQLLRLSEIPTAGPLTIGVTKQSGANEEQQQTRLSGCVSVVGPLFDLERLLLRSNRAVYNVPIFSNDEAPHSVDRFSQLLSAIHREMNVFYDTSIQVDDPAFYPQVLSSACDEKVVDYSTKCRVYIKRMSDWVICLAIAPLDARLMAPRDKSFPLLVSMCDEAQLAWGMIKRLSIGSSVMIRPEFGAPPQLTPSMEPPITTVPSEWVSSIRCPRLLTCNYAAFSLGKSLVELFEEVIERAVVYTFYSCISKGIEIDPKEARTVVEGHCSYTTLEIEAVARALDTFCCHLHTDPCSTGDLVFCSEESNLEKLFNEELGRNFLQVPGLASYFYLCPQKKEEKGEGGSRNHTLARALPFAAYPFDSVSGAGGGGSVRRDSATGAGGGSTTGAGGGSTTGAGAGAVGEKRNNSGDRTPDDDSSLVGSVKQPPEMTPNDMIRMRMALTSAGGSGGETQEKSGKKSRRLETPLFLYFDCAVHYPDGSLDNFPISFLPSCIHQVLELSENKPVEFDIRKVRVKLIVYVLTWPPQRAFGGDEESEEEDEGEMARRADKFLARLPTKERSAVKQLLSRMNSLLELESVLMDSRKDRVTLEKLKTISKFISKECAAGSEGKRMEERSRPLTLVIQSEEALETLKDRLENMTIDYCDLRRAGRSNIYYCCQVDHLEAYWKTCGGRPMSPKGSAASLNRMDESGKSAAAIGSERGESVPPEETASNPPAGTSETTLKPAGTRSCRAMSHDSKDPARHQDGSTDNDEVWDFTRKDVLCDFWVILTVGENVTLQFCQRYESRHERISELAWRICRQTIRRINQELLLRSMYELRECDPLLMPQAWETMAATPNLTRRDDYGEGEGCQHDERIVHDARYTFAPGSFACQLQYQHWFEVHPRLRATGLDPLIRAYDCLRNSLEIFKVTNMPNTYVVRESDGNVMYMRLHTTMETFVASLQTNMLEMRKKVLRETEEGLKTSVLLTMFGVKTPGQEISEELVNRMQKHLDKATMDQLNDMLTKNNRARLDPADVKFIQHDPDRPDAIFHFSVPQGLSGFLSAVNNYIHQHMQIPMNLARFRDESSGGEPRCFLPYPCPGGLPNDFNPSFFIYLRSAQEGISSTGIACLEVRLVSPSGQLAALTDGVLRGQSHSMLVKFTPDARARSNTYRELTHSVSVDKPEEMKGVCAYVQVIVWQIGDVGIADLKSMMAVIVEQAHCDVVTEYGILNLCVLETSPGAFVLPPTTTSSGQWNSQQLPPHSPLPVTSPPNRPGIPPHPKASPVPVDRRQAFKKRDSSEALLPPPPLTPGAVPSEGSVKKALSFFSSDEPRGSVASDSANDVAQFPPSRLPSHINPKFVATAADWFEYVIERTMGDQSGAQNSVVRLPLFTLDSSHTVRETLTEVCDRMEEMLRCDYQPLCDTVSMCEYAARSSRYEVVPTHKTLPFTADLGVDPEETGLAEFAVVCMSHDVARESQRFGYEKTAGDPPDVLKMLAEGTSISSSKDLFLPNLDPFIPRQRILYGTATGGQLTFYLYNFHPVVARQLRSLVHRTVLWHNARSRLLREIGLHKMGITHLSPLQSHHENPYLCLVWRNPDELIDCNYPPDELEISSIEGLPAGYARRLFRPYREVDHAFLQMNRLPCLILSQLEQARWLRNDLRANLNKLRTYSTIHEQLLRGVGGIAEVDLDSLFAASRRVHFVQTPVLLFPRWRRKIAEVRGTIVSDASAEVRKTSHPGVKGTIMSGAAGITSMMGSGGALAATASTMSSVLMRPRANTLSVPSTLQPPPLRFASEDDDPCQVKILYMLMNDYKSYLETLGMKVFHVNQLCKRSETHSLYREEYPQGCRYAPRICMYKVTNGGIVLLRLSFTQPYFILSVRVWSMNEMIRFREPEEELAAKSLLSDLELAKDDIISKCHIHSFTYDFHLRMLSKYLVGKDEVLFNPGYNTSSFLIDFLKYYGCRPPNARNCVYEERPSFELQYGIQGTQIWTHFLELHYEKVYGWKVIKLKNTEEDKDVIGGGEKQRAHEYMLVSSDMPSIHDGKSHETLRVLLRDRRRHEKKGHLNLVQYLFLIDFDQSGPIEDDRCREDSRGGIHLPAAADFRHVERPSTDAETKAEIESLMDFVSQGGIPSLDGHSGRRRFSSGGAGGTGGSGGGGSLSGTPQNIHRAVGGNNSDAESLCSSPGAKTELMRGMESDGGGEGRLSVQASASRRHRRQAGSNDCEIPGEQVMYVQFLSPGQRNLQNLLEDKALAYNASLKKAVSDAERQCRRDQMWESVLLLPKLRKQPASSSRLSAAPRFQPSDTAWLSLRAASQETNSSDLETLLTMVSRVQMEIREPKLVSLLQGTNCARLCRFLFARYSADRCRFFEYPNSNKRCLLITNPSHLDSLFLVTCEQETTPFLILLLKESDLLETSSESDTSKQYNLKQLDDAFDELVQCVTAFLWADLLQKPPGRA